MKEISREKVDYPLKPFLKVNLVVLLINGMYSMYHQIRQHGVTSHYQVSLEGLEVVPSHTLFITVN
jgi:hypothetical protein